VISELTRIDSGVASCAVLNAVVYIRTIIEH